MQEPHLQHSSSTIIDNMDTLEARGWTKRTYFICAYCDSKDVVVKDGFEQFAYCNSCGTVMDNPTKSKPSTDQDAVIVTDIAVEPVSSMLQNRKCGQPTKFGKPCAHLVSGEKTKCAAGHWSLPSSIKF